MEYSIEQIEEIAEKNMQRLLNDEFMVERLPNDDEPYYKNKMKRDSLAIANAKIHPRVLEFGYDD